MKICKYTPEFKTSVIAFRLTHTQQETATEFNLANNTVWSWTYPKEYNAYRVLAEQRRAIKYATNINYRNLVLTRNKHYRVNRSNEQIERHNKVKQAYKKRRKQQDPDYRARINTYNVAINKVRYLNDPVYRLDCKFRAKKGKRKRRALQACVSEIYTRTDELFTRALFNNKCANCGSNTQLCIDHHRALSKGYALTRTNAVLLCKNCNSKKGAKMPADFYTPNILARIEQQLTNIQPVKGVHVRV